MKIRSIVCVALLFALLLTCTGCGVFVVHLPGEQPETHAPAGTAAATDPLPEATAHEYGYPEPVYPTDTAEAKRQLAALYPMDLTGFDLMVASASETRNTILPGADDVTYASRSARNAMVSEKYKNGLYSFALPLAELREKVLASLNAGADSDFYADLLILPADGAAAFITEGIVRDLRALPFYTVRSEAADGSAGVGAVGAGNYFDFSAAADDFEGIYVLYFNRTALGKERTSALYAAALGGGLTWEAFFRLCSELRVEQPAAKLIAFGSAGSGEGTDAGFAADCAAISAGYDLLTPADGKNPPSVALTDAQCASLTELIGSLAGVGIQSDPDAVNTLFAAGKAPFYLGTLAEMAGLYDEKGVEWGLLPLPTGDGLAVNVLARRAPVICVSAGNARVEQTGLMLSAFAAASEGGWLRGEYARAVSEKYLRDNSSCLTLLDVLERPSYRDPAYLFYPVCEGLESATFGALRACLLDGSPIGPAVTAARAAAEENLKSIK